MTTIQALLLGIIQGVTEFFPVSSSGHLKLAQMFFGMENLKGYLFFDFICHLGTFLAIVLIFFKDIKSVVRSERFFIFLIAVGTIPLIPLYFLLGPIREMFNSPQYLGIFFLTTAVILFVGDKFARQAPVNPSKSRNIFTATIVGIFQAMAILPGISRSGATISAAKFLGWDNRDAIRFSFLLFIPAICGGMLIEGKEILTGQEIITSVSAFHYAIGFLTSFILGTATLLSLVKIVQKSKITIFAWYCLFLGILTIFNDGLF